MIFFVVVVFFFFFLFYFFFFQKLQSPQNAKDENPVSDPSSRRLPQISSDLGFSHTAGSCRRWL
jgi:predicted RND superfamily exporter protein